MKKLFFLTILLMFVMSVSVVAQYSTVAVNPKIISTTIQPSDDCYSVCKRDCIAQKLSDDDCARMCNAKCAQPLTRPILTRPQIIEPAQEDCPTMCRSLASQVSLTAKYAGFNFDVFLQCMRDRCKEDCPSACRKMYGAQAMDCVQKYCQPQPPQETCEQGCGRKLDECLKTTVGMNIESIRAACAKLHNECVQEKCGKPEETCEQGCDRKRDECLKTAVGISVDSIRKGCENVHLKCLQDKCRRPEMPECPPQHECEDKCVGGYYNCAKIARTMTAPAGRPEDVQEEYLRRCRLGISECLDECAPELPPEYTCPERCRMVEKECLGAGVDAESCGMKVKDCVTQCYPRPLPPQQCEDRCVQIEKKCEMVDDKGACMMEVRRCRNLCAQGSQVSTGQIAEKDFEGAGRVDTGGRLPSPKDMAGLNPQPEPPSWWKRVFGFFGG
ncbi:MAG TPA: hypothetical protein VI612_03185 [Candidatus Nanoarchaeia archaeon]|nr:hypothetical protein [Candidatus Nanoarchaeia archaeon]